MGLRPSCPLDYLFTSLGATGSKRPAAPARRGSSRTISPTVRALAAKLRKGPQQDALAKFLYGQFSAETQSLLDGKTEDKPLSRALARDFNKILEGAIIYQPDRFAQVKLPALIQKAVQSSQLPNTQIRLNRRLLEEAYPGEIAKSLGGVYPDTEIYTPSYEGFPGKLQRLLGRCRPPLQARHGKSQPTPPDSGR